MLINRSGLKTEIVKIFSIALALNGLAAFNLMADSANSVATPDDIDANDVNTLIQNQPEALEVAKEAMNQPTLTQSPDSASNANLSQIGTVETCQFTDAKGNLVYHPLSHPQGTWAKYSQAGAKWTGMFISNISYASALNQCEGQAGVSATDRFTGIYAQRSLIKALHQVYFPNTLQPSSSAYPFKQVVFFGDSLSDHSNFFNFYPALGKGKEYWDHRFSSGLIWPDWVTTGYQTSNGTGLNMPSINLAWGGAFVAKRRILIIPSFYDEINRYLDFVNSNHLQGDEAQTLYSILIGANDVLFQPTENAQDIASAEESEVNYFIEQIIRNNPNQPVYLLMPTLPDVSITPRVKIFAEEYAAKGPEYARAQLYQSFIMQKQEEVKAYNNLITQYINNLPNTFGNGKVIVFRPRLDEYLNQIVAEADASKLDVKISCMTAGKGPFGKAQVCEVPESAVFWDGLHPNATAGRMLGQEITSNIEQQLGVPVTYQNVNINDPQYTESSKYTYVSPT